MFTATKRNTSAGKRFSERNVAIERKGLKRHRFYIPGTVDGDKLRSFYNCAIITE